MLARNNQPYSSFGSGRREMVSATVEIGVCRGFKAFSKNRKSSFRPGEVARKVARGQCPVPAPDDQQICNLAYPKA